MNMKILNPNSDTQTITIIPRIYVDSVDMTVYNENTGQTVSYDGLPVSNENGYSTLSFTLEPKNEHHFVITVKEGAYQIYKCKAHAKE
jgi:hypothetical protein